MIKELINSRKPLDAVTEILLFVLVILISTFILRYTWNNSLVNTLLFLRRLTRSSTPYFFLFLFR